jgi:hypothetical protein
MNDDALAKAVDERMRANRKAAAARRKQKQEARKEFTAARVRGLQQRQQNRLQRQGPQVDTPAELRRAARPGRCSECELTITPGDLIARTNPDQPWLHAGCINPDRNS